MPSKDIKKLYQPIVKVILGSNLTLNEAIKGLKEAAFYESLLASYGNASKASDLLGDSPWGVTEYKRNFCADVEWPRDPNKSLPDPGVRLQNHKPLSDEDFPMVKK